MMVIEKSKGLNEHIHFLTMIEMKCFRLKMVLTDIAEVDLSVPGQTKIVVENMGVKKRNSFNHDQERRDRW